VKYSSTERKPLGMYYNPSLLII